MSHRTPFGASCSEIAVNMACRDPSHDAQLIPPLPVSILDMRRRTGRGTLHNATNAEASGGFSKFSFFSFFPPAAPRCTVDHMHALVFSPPFFGLPISDPFFSCSRLLCPSHLLPINRCSKFSAEEERKFREAQFLWLTQNGPHHSGVLAWWGIGYGKTSTNLKRRRQHQNHQQRRRRKYRRFVSSTRSLAHPVAPHTHAPPSCPFCPPGQGANEVEAKRSQIQRQRKNRGEKWFLNWKRPLS